MKRYLRERIESCLKSLGVDNALHLTFEKPRTPEHGDLTTNIAMISAKSMKTNPREFAQRIVKQLEVDSTLVDRVEIAGPGFINFHFTDKFYLRQLAEIMAKGPSFGRVDIGKRKKTQIEFVSANPTGPLTVGHGRGAVFGDTVARLLEWTNYDVTREYYFNNAGRQMRILGESVRLRYRELLGEKIDFPEDYYQGEYIKEIARHVLEMHGKDLAGEQLDAVCKSRAEEER